MSNPVGRIGDTCTHGATLITGSGTRFVDGIPVVRLGDLVYCPQLYSDNTPHGLNPIITVNSQVFTENKATVVVSAIAQCGAVVISGSPNTTG